MNFEVDTRFSYKKREMAQRIFKVKDLHLVYLRMRKKCEKSVLQRKRCSARNEYSKLKTSSGIP